MEEKKENRGSTEEKEVVPRKTKIAPYRYKGKSYPVYQAESFPVESIGREWDHKNHNVKAKKKYYLEFGCFDIETTSHIVYQPSGDIDVEQSFGYMYTWQFCTGYQLAVGRTWAEWIRLLQRIRNHLSEDATYIIYVHNLSFEFQFLYGILQYYGYRDLDFFAISSRKVLTLIVKDLHIEMRCSYRLTGESLVNLLTDVPGVTFAKLKGDLDYRVERTPLSRMRPKEKAYCYHDVLGLYDALKKDFAIRGEDTCTIPLTKTGFIRRELKAIIKPLDWYRKLMMSAAMDPHRFRMARSLARGGDTLASMSHPLYTVLHGLDSWDFKSSHPRRMFGKYPLGKLEYEGKDLGKGDTALAKLDKIEADGRYYMTRVLFVGLDLKDYTTPIPALMEYKAEYAARGWRDPDDPSHYIGPIIYNGRLIAASSACFCLDMPTFKMVREQYKWKEIYVQETYSCDYDYLPPIIRDFVRKVFERKCQWEIKKKSIDKHGEDYDYVCRQYAMSKAALNSIFGMFYTSPLRGDYRVEEDGSWSESIADPADMTEEQRKDLYKNQILAPGQYLWGVHTAAMSRLALDELIKTIGYEETVYSDTDSDKAFSSPDVDERVRLLNKRIIKESREQGATVTIGDREFVLGVVEKETDTTYPEFVTGGAKKYCYREEGKLHVVVSGVAKKYQDDKGEWHDTADQLQDDIRNFQPSFRFDPAGGNVLHYRDQAVRFMDAVGDDGTACRVLVAGSIYMTSRVVTLGRVFDTRGAKADVDDMMMAMELETLIDKDE